MGGSGGGGSRSFGRSSKQDRAQEHQTTRSGGGRNDDSANDCTKINFKAILQSPKRDVIMTLKLGDVLKLQLTEGGPPVSAVTQTGQVAGGVVADIKRLVDCLKKGHSFVADVLSIDGGAVEVHVHSE